MAKKTPLQIALERGLADGGNLFEALNELEQYEIESVEDAEALVDALELYVQRPVEAPGMFTAFHQLVSLFQSVSGVSSFQYLVRRGIPVLIRAYDVRLPMANEQQNELLFAVK